MTTSRATSTAFSAAIRRLSATIQNQQARASLRSWAMSPTVIPLCPAAPTLVAGSYRPFAHRYWRAQAGLEIAVDGRSANSTQMEKL